MHILSNFMDSAIKINLHSYDIAEPLLQNSRLFSVLDGIAIYCSFIAALLVLLC